MWALRKIQRIPYTRHVTNVEVRATIGCHPLSHLNSKGSKGNPFAALCTYCPQLTTTSTRGPPPCCRCGDGGCLQIGSDRQEDPATPGFVQWKQTLANRTLALHLPGGRQLFVTTGGALWTQQRSSEVCYKRRRIGYSCAFRCVFTSLLPTIFVHLSNGHTGIVYLSFVY